MERDFEIPLNENGKIDCSRLESTLDCVLSSNPEENSVNLLGDRKEVMRELVGSYLQQSYDYSIIGVSKKGNNYLIKVGAKI